jgi:hypothetical protein
MRIKFSISAPTTEARVIPVAPAAGKLDLLCDSKGRPVWPIADEEARELLAGSAALFGGLLEEVDGRAAASSSGSEEIVIGIGDVAHETALYAHLTHRQARMVKSSAELADHESVSIVVYCGPRLDRDIVQWLSLSPPQRMATGIIWGRTPQELACQVALSACAASLNGPLETPQYHVQCSSDTATPENLHVGPQLRRGLEAGAGVLSIAGHSDGLFQWLQGGTALCTRAAWPLGAEDTMLPQCTETNFCHRLDRSMDSVLAEERLIPPEAIAARVMVHVGCHSAFVGSPSVDAVWGMLPRLVANPRIGALLATPSLSVAIHEVINRELVRFLIAGASVGDAVGMLEENTTMQECNYRFLLFGDPRVQGGSSAGREMHMRDAGSVQMPGSGVGAVGSSDLPALREMAELEIFRLLAFVDAAKGPAAVASSQNLMSCITDFEARNIGPDDLDRTTALQSAALNRLAYTKVRLFEVWGSRSRVQRGSSKIQCPICGWRGVSRHIVLPSGAERELYDCPGCSDVWDRPHPDPPVRIEMKFPELLLTSDRADSVCSAAWYVVRLQPEETEMRPWPVDENGDLEERLVVDLKSLASGPLKVYGVLVSDLAIQAIGARARGAALRAPTGRHSRDGVEMRDTGPRF